jgi:hypothetical protein
MPSTHKKVIVRKLDRDAVSGYVAPANFTSEGRLELLNTSGKVVYIALADIKGIYFVRDFSESEGFARKTFTTRPRTAGLWVRLKFRDNEVVEAMMPNDLTQVGLEGFLVIPPDTRGNTQRIFAAARPLPKPKPSCSRVSDRRHSPFVMPSGSRLPQLLPECSPQTPWGGYNRLFWTLL